MSIKDHPFEFRVGEDHSFGVERGTLFFPEAVEDACWKSFLASTEANESVDSGDGDIDFVTTQQRTEHLVLDYPPGSIRVTMRMLQFDAHQVTVFFEHFVEVASIDTKIVQSQKTIACVRKFDTRSLPAEWPESIKGRLVRLRKAGHIALEFRYPRMHGWLAHLIRWPRSKQDS